jgi:predicted ATPase
MVNEFMVKNYRNVSVDNTSLGKINLLIGPNGSGKSNFLRALEFWAKVVQNRPKPNEGTTALFETLSQNGWNRMLNFEADSSFIDFSWIFSSDRSKEPYQYKMKLHIGDKSINQLDFYIASEYFAYAKPLDTHHSTPYRFFNCHEEAPGAGYFSYVGSTEKLPVRNNEVAFLQLDELRDIDKDFDENYRSVYAERMNDLLKFLSRFFSYSCSNFNLKQIKKPIKSNPSSFLSPDAGNLVNVLHRWLQEDYDTFYEYRKMITPLFGEIHPVEVYIEPVPQTNDSQLMIGVRKQRYLLDDLSDGTIRAMIMAALLVDRKDKMSVCSIDEPEMNLHPEWQSRFSDWLLASDASQQFFISSHSPEILDPLTPAFINGDLKLFVFSDTEPLKELSPDNISELYGKGFNIGDLYRSKAIEIGGWPK